MTEHVIEVRVNDAGKDGLKQIREGLILYGLDKLEAQVTDGDLTAMLARYGAEVLTEVLKMTRRSKRPEVLLAKLVRKGDWIDL